MGYTSKIRGKHKVFDFGQVGAALFFVNPRSRDLTRDGKTKANPQNLETSVHLVKKGYS